MNLILSVVCLSLITVYCPSVTLENVSSSNTTDHTQNVTQNGSSTVNKVELDSSSSNITTTQPAANSSVSSSQNAPKSSCENCSHSSHPSCHHCESKLSKVENEVKNKTDGLDQVGRELNNIDQGMSNFTETLGHINSHLVHLQNIGSGIFCVRVIAPLLKDVFTKLIGYVW